MSQPTRKMAVVLFVSILSVFLLLPTLAQAQSSNNPSQRWAHSENKPLKSWQEEADREHGRPVQHGAPQQVPNFSDDEAGYPGKGRSAAPATAAPDALLQSAPGQQATAVGSGFYGASNNDNANIVGGMVAPPDTDGEVGKDFYVQMINLLTTVFDKNGTRVAGPARSSIYWNGMGGNCQTYNRGDPVVLYDDVADRWIVSQFAFPSGYTPASQCVAVSQTPDPRGGWNRYEFSFSDLGFNDYPKLGIVSNSITMMANLFIPPSFGWGGTFLGVLDKAAMYAGQSASLVGFNIGTSQWGFVAGDMDGAGSVPALFATAMSASNRFDIWRLNIDWNNANPPATASVSRIAALPVTSFSTSLCSASRGACIPQPNNGPLLESLSDRLMHKLQIRDFGDHRSMVTAHTVNVGGGRAGIRWYELRESNGTWSLYQQGTFAPDDGRYRWMPSAAMNSLGDIGIGYLLSSTNTYVSTAVAGQSAAASGSGELDSDELICAAGTGVQTNVARSGDYSSTSVDPDFDTFWHTNEVFTTTGSYQWNTYICEFAVGNGSSNKKPTASFTHDCNGLSCTFTNTSTDPDQGDSLSASWAFGDGHVSTTLSPSHTFTASGTYTVTLTVTDLQNASASTSKDVGVFDPNGGPFDVFYDSFENGEWNSRWTEDSQNDWFVSTQRATHGSHSAEVDGSANNAQLISIPIDLLGQTQARVTFNWLIESGLDTGEYIAFDISTNGGSSWQEQARLRGNVDPENSWQPVSLDLTGLSSLRLRFRGSMSASDEDADVDEVRVTIGAGSPPPPPNQDPVADFTYVCTNLGCSFTDQSTDGDGTIASRSWNFGDGGTSSATNPSHTFASGGSYTVSLTVTDNQGASGSTNKNVTVSAANQSPAADFSYSCTNLVCSFTDQSGDSDGSVVSWSWNFGDGNTSTAQSPTHTFALANSYTVSLTVTDNQGATGSTSQSVTVTSSGGGPIEVFSDSFENGAWNGKWSEDNQNDWFTSTQRATDGRYSAEVDGSASDAQLNSVDINLQGKTSVTITFDWYIERSLDTGEYLAFLVSTDGGSNWTQQAILRGNADPEESWQPVQVDLFNVNTNTLLLRFIGKMSDSREDADVDNVKVVVQ